MFTVLAVPEPLLVKRDASKTTTTHRVLSVFCCFGSASTNKGRDLKSKKQRSIGEVDSPDRSSV